MSEDKYYSIPRASASILSCVEALLLNMPLMKGKPETLEFGRQLHEAILEPGKYAAGFNVYPERYKPNELLIKKMSWSARQNILLNWMLRQPSCKVEKEIFFVDDDTGIECKLKYDIGVNYALGDIKSTAEKTLAGFKETIIKYKYNRQGAFYLDATGAERITFFGISKVAPHETFTFTFTTNDPEIENGRQEYKRLLLQYDRLKSEGVDFIKLMKGEK